MRVLIAPDKFKGSLSAREAGEAIARGFRSARPDCECSIVPMADGGEGTVDAFVDAGARRRTASVHGPLGDTVSAQYAIDGDLAVIEMAAASGLSLLPEARRDPLRATTYGTGELLLAAAREGAKRCIVGIGGSATIDVGTGMLRALGARFIAQSGDELGDDVAAYERLERIDLGGLDASVNVLAIDVACDVRNPLLGEQGAARVFGPQKGASPQQVGVLERVAKRIADVTAETLGRDLRDTPGAGAAGGLGFALTAFLNARIENGALLIAKERGVDCELRSARLCATGEGSIDAQTLQGKVVSGIGELAREKKVPVVAFGGIVDAEAARALRERSIECVEIAGGVPKERALKEAATLLERRAATWATSYTRWEA